MTPCTQGMHYFIWWNLVYDMWIYCSSASVVLCPQRVITFSETLSAWTLDHPYGLTEDTTNRIYLSHSCLQCTGVAV